MVETAYHVLLLGAMLVLGVLIILGIIRSVLGPGISDRIIAVNMIGTIIIMLIAILSLYLDENYLVDVCLIYAMVSFLGVVVLCKVYTGVYLQKRNRKANLTAIEDNLEQQAQVRESGVVEADAEKTGSTESGSAEEAGNEIAVKNAGSVKTAVSAEANCMQPEAAKEGA